MFQAIRLVGLTVLLSIACLTARANGACEPWASNTDPMDLPKSHVQDITTAPFTYNITQGGTMDGRMITGESGGTGGTVTVSVTLTKEHRLVHDKDTIKELPTRGGE